MRLFQFDLVVRLLTRFGTGDCPKPLSIRFARLPSELPYTLIPLEISNVALFTCLLTTPQKVLATLLPLLSSENIELIFPAFR